MKLITERTQLILTSARLGADVKTLAVPDDSPLYDEEQLGIFDAYKAAFGISDSVGAITTLKAAVNKEAERVIYEPSVIARDGKPVIDWGGAIFPLPASATFRSSRCVIAVEIGDEEFSLSVRIMPIKKEDLNASSTAVQKAWANCTKDRPDMLMKLWDKGTIVDIMPSGYDMVNKLADCLGTNTVVGYKMGAFDKYVVLLEDGRWIRANTALQEKLDYYNEVGIEVSKKKPAKMTVSDTGRLTNQDHKIYKVNLVSFANLDLPVFDFVLGEPLPLPALQADLTGLEPVTLDIEPENIPF